MSFLFTAFLLLSLIFALIHGQMPALSASIPEGAAAGVDLVVRLTGPLCLWSGLSSVMEAAGWIRRLSGWMSPFLSRIFSSAWQDRQTREALCSNFSANLLGLGNAATPPGIRAARQMAAGGQATDELCRLVVMNTASIQLIPATVAAIRSSLGASAPFSILPAVWLTSLCSVAAGLTAARILSRWL